MGKVEKGMIKENKGCEGMEKMGGLLKGKIKSKEWERSGTGGKG